MSEEYWRAVADMYREAFEETVVNLERVERRFQEQRVRLGADA